MNQKEKIELLKRIILEIMPVYDKPCSVKHGLKPLLPCDKYNSCDDCWKDALSLVK